MESNKLITGYYNLDKELLDIAKGDGSEGLSEEETFLLAKDISQRIERRINTLLTQQLSAEDYQKYIALVQKGSEAEIVINFLSSHIPSFAKLVAESVEKFLSQYRC